MVDETRVLVELPEPTTDVMNITFTLGEADGLGEGLSVEAVSEVIEVKADVVAEKDVAAEENVEKVVGDEEDKAWIEVEELAAAVAELAAAFEPPPAMMGN